MANLRELIRSAVERAEKDLKKQQPPKVRYDSHTKKISVTHDFCFGKIPKIKIIASCQRWLKIYDSVIDQKRMKIVSFESIRNDLSRRCPRLKKEELERYAHKDLNSFLDDLFICAHYARCNPYCYPKKIRTSSHYDLKPEEKNEVSNMAARLYIYLRQINKLPRGQRPYYIGRFLRTYGIDRISSRESLLQDDIKNILSKYYGE